jgi:hypothetical protein
MTELPAIEVTSKLAYGYQKVRLETDNDTGHLLADFEPVSGVFKIQGFGVSAPRIGLGKELLRRAEEEARQLSARTIVATIVSRECLASMTEVFGGDNIAIKKQGDFGNPSGNTLASLLYHIEEPYL